MGKLDAYISQAKEDKRQKEIDDAKVEQSSQSEPIPLLQSYIDKAEDVINEMVEPVINEVVEPVVKSTPKTATKRKRKPTPRRKPKVAKKDIDVKLDLSFKTDAAAVKKMGSVIIETKPEPKNKGKLREAFELESAYAAMPPETRLILETLERLIEKIEQIVVTSHEIHVPPPIINVTLPETKKTVTKLVERDENNLVKSIIETVSEEQLTPIKIETEDN